MRSFQFLTSYFLLLTSHFLLMTTSAPFLVSHYAVEVTLGGDFKVDGTFGEVSGLNNEVQMIKHEIFNPETLRSQTILVPGQGFSNGTITLKRGVTSNTGFWKWFDLVQQGRIDEARGRVMLGLYDYKYSLAAKWIFERAWPSKLTGPNMTSESGKYGMEELTVHYEYMRRELS